jgi:hypothetical protein
MTPSQLKYNHESLNPNSFYFSRDSMRFFGDTMQNYGVKTHADSYELYRKHPVKHGLSNSAYFDKTSFIKLNREITL